MKLLDAVNLVLPKLGEHGVTSVDTKHPTLAVLLPEIDIAQRVLLLRGWWFNEFPYKAYPDSEGGIALGSNVLSFVPKYCDNVAQRGNALYNNETMSYIFTEHVEGRVVEFIDFEELPESAAISVLYSALVSMYSTDIGLTEEVKLWSGMASTAYSDLIAEHCRQRKHSTRKSYKWAKLRRAMRS